MPKVRLTEAQKRADRMRKSYELLRVGIAGKKLTTEV